MLDAHILLGALSMVFLCSVDVVWAQTTVSISATASHPVPTTLCEFGLAIMLNGIPLIKCTLWLLCSWTDVRGMISFQTNSAI
jgi:hypothetical protein